MKWIHAINDYKDYLKIERGLSDNSIISYENDLKKLESLLTNKSQFTGPLAVKPDQIKEFVYHISKEVKANSQSRIISGIRSFYDYLLFEKLINNNDQLLTNTLKHLEKENSKIIIIAAKIEQEINELDSYDDRQVFLNDYGLKESGTSLLINEAHKLLNLSTFYTAGKKEVRAWTFMNGSKAPKVAGVIHSDFEKGFIRAETISYIDFVENDGWVKSKESGKMRLEYEHGPLATICEDDVIQFFGPNTDMEQFVEMVKEFGVNVTTAENSFVIGDSAGTEGTVKEISPGQYAEEYAKKYTTGGMMDQMRANIEELAKRI